MTNNDKATAPEAPRFNIIYPDRTPREFIMPDRKADRSRNFARTRPRTSSRRKALR